MAKLLWMNGVHFDKTALITGSSRGIGKQTALQLALAGARVAITARNPLTLTAARDEIVRELEDLGAQDVSSKVFALPEFDLSNADSAKRIANLTLEKFGHLDFLINNASIPGAESQIVDMDDEAWESTLTANLASQYELILNVLPAMKAHGSGHILNVSSQFGGLRHAAVAYPNRADYAVSKAGARALAEELAPFLGPEVQINAVAPGQVDGDRLRGTRDCPGLYRKRAEQGLAYKRLNQVHRAALEAFEEGSSQESILRALATNDTRRLIKDEQTPPELSILAHTLVMRSERDHANAGHFLLTRPLAEKLLSRLRRAGWTLPEATDESFFANFTPAPHDFFPEPLLAAASAHLHQDVLRKLPLHRLPSESDIAREMLSYLGNQNLTGETLHPSCGIKLDRLAMSGDFVGRAHPDLVAELANQTICIVGDSMIEDMAHLASTFIENSRGRNRVPHLKQLCLVTGSEIGLRRLKERLEALGLSRTSWFASRVHLDCEPSRRADAAIDRMAAKFGLPHAIVSFPMSEIRFREDPTKTAWENLPSGEQFRQLIRDHLTHHFLVARRASLIDGCRVVFVTSRLPSSATPQAQAFASLLRTTLRPLTVTAGVEASRLATNPTFNQIDVNDNLDRPGGAGYDPEVAVMRFLETILLMSLPPAAGEARLDSRRIHPATTITV